MNAYYNICLSGFSHLHCVPNVFLIFLRIKDKNLKDFFFWLVHDLFMETPAEECLSIRKGNKPFQFKLFVDHFYH